MQAEDTQPVDWDLRELKSALQEWQAIASSLLELLHKAVADDVVANWRPHVMQIERAVRQYGDLCRQESERFGMWREDGLQPEEVYDEIWEQGDRLVKWLLRMVV